MLRDYEILYIVRPELDEEQLGEAVRTVAVLIGNLGGTALRTDVWGRRRLAYEVRHLREGHYVLTDFRIEPARVPEMEATLKISETVFRHLIVRKPDGAAPAAEAAQAEEAGAAAEMGAASDPEAAGAREPDPGEQAGGAEPEAGGQPEAGAQHEAEQAEEEA